MARDPLGLVAGVGAELVNRRGGYRFLYPSHWIARRRGRHSRVAAPEGDIVVVVGSAPDGPLDLASRRSSAAIVDEYGHVRSLASQAASIGGRAARLVAGRTTSRRGVPLRFLAVTVDAGVRNYGIVVFVHAGSAPEATLPPVQGIVGSFEVMDGSEISDRRRGGRAQIA